MCVWGWGVGSVVVCVVAFVAVVVGVHVVVAVGYVCGVVGGVGGVGGGFTNVLPSDIRLRRAKIAANSLMLRFYRSYTHTHVYVYVYIYNGRIASE